MSSTDQPQMTRRQRREAKRAATRRKLSRVVGASMVAVLGLGMFTAASAQEAVAGWDDTSRAGTTLQTIDFDTRPWRAAHDAELKRILRGMGQIMKETPLDAGFPHDRIKELHIDPLSFDRTRHNLSWCRYSNGAWSVAATTAYSTRQFDRGLDAIPLSEQYVHTSKGDFREPTTTLAQGQVNRCDADGLAATTRISSGWLFSHGTGVIENSRGNLAAFYIPNTVYPTHRPEPWKREQSDINNWVKDRDTEMVAIMRQIGAGVSRLSPGETLNTTEIKKVDFDPRAGDRSRHNFSYCNYDNGKWSVAATSVGSTSDYNNTKHHYILRSDGKLWNPGSILGGSKDGRCDLDGINDGVKSDWFWSRNVGALSGSGRDGTWVLPDAEVAGYQAKPYAWEVE